MSDEKLVNIASLMTTYNFEIEQLPDDLKCAQCKLVLTDACQLPCCCRYCRACIDDMMSRGSEFCPGGSEDCGESTLSSCQSDYSSNRRVLKLTVKCPHDWCVHDCQLTSMEEHLRECQRRNEDCPFLELGCTQDKLAAEEMCGHLQHESRKHSEILIGMIANINREIDTLKNELVLKDGQIKSMMDQMLHLENENKSIKNDINLIKNENKSIKDDIKSIKEEKEDLAGRVTNLTEKIEREIDERRENDDVNMARVIEHVDREIATVTGLIGSNKEDLDIEVQSVRNDIRSIYQATKLINEDNVSCKPQVESIQTPEELEQFDAIFEWLIDGDVGKTCWGTDRLSEYFTGEVHPYKYRLGTWNSELGIGTALAALCIQLHIHAGPNDGQLAWPFEARVVITVTDRDRRELCRSIKKQCQIERPPDNGSRRSDPFLFLIRPGLNLSHGVRVSCVIVSSVLDEVGHHISLCSD